MTDKANILHRVAALKKNAAERWNVTEENVHVGHIALQAMLEEPDAICQIETTTGEQEINKSVARRSCRLASAMQHYGLKPGDPVIVMGPNHLDLCIPYFACHFAGYSMCAVDPAIGPDALSKLLPYVNPKMIFCEKSTEEKVKQALKVTRKLGKIVVFDDQEADMNAFVKNYSGSHVNFRPGEFNHSETAAWLMLTSGTTGLPKVAIIPFDTLLNAIISWWEPFSTKIASVLPKGSLQWVSTLILFISGPVKGYHRIQSSIPLTPEILVGIIGKYRPEVTVWTPYLLGQFLTAAEKVCDFSCFKYIIIGGSAIDKPLLDKFKKQCGAFLYLAYGMTELCAPVFDFDENTPFGSTGKPKPTFEYKLMDDNDQPLETEGKTGELWIKGNSFFKGYLNNPEETKTVLTEDGWFRTGDLFYKDQQEYYYFVERKKLLIKHYGFMISPLQMEDIIKRHPGVADVCVVGLPELKCIEMPVIAVLKKNGSTVNSEDIIDLLKNNMDGKRLSGAIFFVDSLPTTPSGKVHRAKVKEMALTAERSIF